LNLNLTTLFPMPEAISDAIRLYGTDEPVEPPRILRTGPLTAEFEAGNLRHIRYRGREMIRAISFVVRDKNWGTYAPQIGRLHFQEEPEAFRVSYEATVKEGEEEFRFSAEIEGQSDGSLYFSGKGTAISDFLTNRTGFVVLHPLEGVAGDACTIEHVDGTIEETRFPLLIDPVQPMTALRGITHQFIPGLKVSCRMEGDTFEMEDQRNWTDASYKTYVRPLALPWPYLIAKSEKIDQKVTLTVSGSATEIESAGGALLITLGKPTSRAMPPLGLGLDPKDLEGTEQNFRLLKQAAASHLVCYYDPRLGHSPADLIRVAAIGRALGVELWLEFVIPTVDHFERDIQDLGRAVRELDDPFAAVMISPAPDLKCTLPGSPWPPCPPLEDCYRALRAALPEARLGGGMASFFTELNRKRPPVGLLDFVTFTTVAIFHAGDDRSAMEGLESLPYLAKSVESFIGGKPYHVGPSAIGLRMNPYGEAPMANPRNIRQAMNGMDPRQRGLFAAAWSVGYVARFAQEGASALTLGGTVGEFGIAYAKSDYPQPWFDEAGGVYPVFHAIKGLAGLRGQPLIDLVISNPREVQAIAAERDGQIEVWLANLTDQPVTVELKPKLVGSLSVLSAAEFELATQDASVMRSLERPFSRESIALPPYAIARLTGLTPDQE
jgi:D-apionolactonase